MTRHEMLCEALRQLGCAINTMPTSQVIEACREAVPDVAIEEIMGALNAAAQQYKDEAEALKLYSRARRAGITGVIDWNSG